ncbi:MAG TPA: 3-hydroxyacyl-CoA dehydrogenase family protein [Chitinophagaceae bacterium]|nr:3-hydroxyacyl-CoA dehydrogenase family protein [Chitinophagaceae bacterium]
MTIAVIADEQLRQEFLLKPMPPTADLVFVATTEQVPAAASIVIDLLFTATPARINQLQAFLPRPTLVNAVADTLANIAQPFIRINAWPGFLQRVQLEAAALPAQAQQLKDLCTQLGWQYTLVPDLPGMLSARILACIINEAFFTLADGVSTKEGIDTAMKLGTNYPYGPFEWSEKIGLEKIHHLLSTLSKENNLYNPCSLISDAIFV